ncbi:MAG: magnesium/cobalt transporter CorA, partial [Waterburya sp.]
MTEKSSSLSNRIQKLSKQFSFNYFYHQPGSLPGTIAIADQAKASEINLIDYNQEKLFQQTKITAVECATHLDSESVSWLDIAGLGDKLTLQSLGEVFNLHPLILEAIVNVPQRPKIEDHQNQLVIITQMANLKPKADGFWLEQVSFVLGKNYLLTVQEEPERDCFDPIRDRLNRNRGTIRQEKADYLTYCLWDAIIDGYFPILEAYGEKIELLEDAVIQKSSDRILAKIYRVRRELLALRRGIWSQRDALNSLIREGHPLISEHVMPYFKDCYDHTVQIIDTIETYRELASG